MPIKINGGIGRNMSMQEKNARREPNWVINVTAACESRGIKNPYQLWQRIGGSKATTAQLFQGKSQMIRTETMNRLQKELGITPFEYLINMHE
jgi:DNA-binding Xre family transcriptional regulator